MRAKALAIVSFVALAGLHAQGGGGAQGVQPASGAQAPRGGGGRGVDGDGVAAGIGGRGAAEPTLWLPDDEFVRWPYSDPAYKKIDGFKIKAHINEITAISRKSRDEGNQYWGRITGTSYDKQTTDWVAAQFNHIGLEQVHVQEFDLPTQWFPTSWEVVAKGTGKPVPIKTAFPLYQSVGTRLGATGTGLAGNRHRGGFHGTGRQREGGLAVRLPEPRRPQRHGTLEWRASTCGRGGSGSRVHRAGIPRRHHE